MEACDQFTGMLFQKNIDRIVTSKIKGCKETGTRTSRLHRNDLNAFHNFQCVEFPTHCCTIMSLRSAWLRTQRRCLALSQPRDTDTVELHLATAKRWCHQAGDELDEVWTRLLTWACVWLYCEYAALGRPWVEGVPCNALPQWTEMMTRFASSKPFGFFTVPDDLGLLTQVLGESRIAMVREALSEMFRKRVDIYVNALTAWRFTAAAEYSRAVPFWQAVKEQLPMGLASLHPDPFGREAARGVEEPRDPRTPLTLASTGTRTGRRKHKTKRKQRRRR